MKNVKNIPTIDTFETALVRVALPLLCLLVSLPATMATAQAADTQKLSVPISDPARPVVLEASTTYGSIFVTGYDGKEVQVEVVSPGPQEETPRRVDGLLKIPNTSVGLTIEEHNNTVEIDTDLSSDELVLRIKVPVRTSVRLHCVNGEQIEVQGVDGEHELSHTNGGIRALAMRGSVVAETTNGDVEVELLQVTADTPMSFASFNGDVKVTAPSSLKADLGMRSQRGDIYTDFDVKLQPTQAKVTRDEGGKGYRVRMERQVRGTVGGGGPEFTFKTFNGDIYLVQHK